MAPVLMIISICMMAKFKLRMPTIAKVMLFSIILTQIGETYLSIYILFFTEKSLGYVIALIAWGVFILFSIFTYQYFAFELQRVKTFIQSKDILDFKIRMRRIQKIKLLYASLVLLMIILSIINFFVFKKKDDILNQTLFEVIAVRSSIVLIIVLNIYVVNNSLIFFVQKKIKTRQFQGVALTGQERVYIGFVVSFVFILCLYPVFFVTLIVLDIIYFDKIEHFDKMDPTGLQSAMFQCLFMDYRMTNVVGSFMLLVIFYNMTLKYQKRFVKTKLFQRGDYDERFSVQSYREAETVNTQDVRDLLAQGRTPEGSMRSNRMLPEESEKPIPQPIQATVSNFTRSASQNTAKSGSGHYPNAYARKNKHDNDKTARWGDDQQLIDVDMTSENSSLMSKKPSAYDKKRDEFRNYLMQVKQQQETNGSNNKEEMPKMGEFAVYMASEFDKESDIY
ncbi:hypothetical protein FGO68_gene13616 [Halteria grandinella]|uniref:Uncharacterized protein n=1 Tax=Halteria grandinella TaxID=5974 RepID=A0A8J8T280_HALGN|nr:hypothetical protein FGO68_gene13616 [Halteria grandinella]